MFIMRSAPCYLLPAIRPRRFSTEKARKSVHFPLITPQPKAGSKRERGDKQGTKSLDAAAIEISVGFYKNCVAIFYTDKNNMIR